MFGRRVFLLFLLSLFALLHLLQGTAALPWADVWAVLSGGEPSDAAARVIVLEWRLPRMLTAVFAGACLGLSGLLMQTLFRNPIAGPDVLGISLSASLGVAVLILACGGAALAGWTTALAAGLGAVGGLLLLLGIAWRLPGSGALLIVGLMLSSVFGALVSLLQYFSGRDELQQFVFWTMGSLSGTTWSELRLWAALLLPALLAAWALSKPLDAWLLGTAAAAALGVSPARLRLSAIALTAMLTGLTTAFCGPIAFVGIAVPHLARRLFRTHSHAVLVPYCALCGALALLACQWLACLPSPNRLIPINVITSLVGAPVVVAVLLRRSMRSEEY